MLGTKIGGKDDDDEKSPKKK